MTRAETFSFVEWFQFQVTFGAEEKSWNSPLSFVVNFCCCYLFVCLFSIWWLFWSLFVDVSLLFGCFRWIFHSFGLHFSLFLLLEPPEKSSQPKIPWLVLIPCFLDFLEKRWTKKTLGNSPFFFLADRWGIGLLDSHQDSHPDVIFPRKCTGFLVTFLVQTSKENLPTNRSLKICWFSMCVLFTQSSLQRFCWV